MIDFIVPVYLSVIAPAAKKKKKKKRNSSFCPSFARRPALRKGLQFAAMAGLPISPIRFDAAVQREKEGS